MKKIALIILSLSSLAFAIDAGKKYDFKTGEDAYNQVCAYCHTINIAPKSIYTKLKDKASIEGRRDSIIYVVRNGLNAMPAFRKSEISDKVLKDLATKLANGKITVKTK